MIFVTGGSGLLGSHLLAELTEGDEPITAMFRSEKKLELVRHVFRYYKGEEWQKDFSKINWIEGNILDITFLLEKIPEQSKVYHCAALVSFHSRDFNKLMKINREGTANVVNACLEKNVKKLCYVSSTAAIGSPEGKMITENDKWKKTPTTSGYSIAKYSAEKEVWRGIEEGLNAVIVNPCVIFGAGDWNESSLSIFKTVARGLKYYPPGSNAIVDARDVSEIMIRLMESDIHSERFLCVGSNQTFNRLINEIADAMGIERPKKMASKRMTNAVRLLSACLHLFSSSRSGLTKETMSSLYSTREYSNTKVRDMLNFEFRTLPDTINNAVKGKCS